MTKLELKRKILKVLKVFNGREEAIFDTCWKEIADLEKKNAELKARLNAINLLTPELEKLSKLKTQQLTKAIEIIKEFARLEYADYTDGDYSNELSQVLEQAEQFLKEIEK